MTRPIQYAPREIDTFVQRGLYLSSIASGVLTPVEISEHDANAVPGVRKYIKKEPLGIVLVLAAWNFPWLIAVNSIVPALCAGK